MENLDQIESAETKILSFDSSSTCTGWALFSRGFYKDSGIIDFKKIKDSKVRMENMVTEIALLIRKVKPNIVVVENTAITRNAYTQRILTMILGAIYGECVLSGIHFHAFFPVEWRKWVDPVHKPKKRSELKEWAVQTVQDLYNLQVDDDRAEAILLGRAYIKMYESYD